MTLDYGNYGIDLIMGNGVFISSTVERAIFTRLPQSRNMPCALCRGGLGGRVQPFCAVVQDLLHKGKQLLRFKSM